jgi:hypothetical protein
VFTSGAVKVGGTTAAPNIQLLSTGFVGFGGAPATRVDVHSTGGMIRIGGASGNNIIQAYQGASGLGMWSGGTTRFYSTGSMTLSVNATLGTDYPTGLVDAVNITPTGDFLLGGTLPASPAIALQANGNISYTGTLTPPSDATLKEAIVDADLDSQWDDIKRIQLRKYQWKDEPERGTMLGVIAQELETISPGLIVKDTDDDGNAVEGSCKVKVDALYMKMLGALQVAQQRIEDLETRLAALEPAPPQKQTNTGAK